MPQNMPIRILDQSSVTERPAGGSKIIGLELDIFGKRLNFNIAASGVACLADAVPPARAICDKIANVTTEQIRAEGRHIPCCEKCPACCNYLVSMSVPEVMCFKREVFYKHKHPLNRILPAYLHAARRILRHRPPENLFNAAASSPYGPPETKALADWYDSLNLVCPFLRQNKCIIYEHRPFVCREHFVTGSAMGCRKNKPGAQTIEMPLQMSNVLCRLSKELCNIDEAVMMPFALSWWDINNQLCLRTWPAEMMAEMLAEIIKESVCSPVCG
jgi:Fe-S-cluster containining protein